MTDWFHGVLLEKFNPNHDDLGRFSSVSGGASDNQYFHGTASRFVNRIIREGIKPGGSGRGSFTWTRAQVEAMPPDDPDKSTYLKLLDESIEAHVGLVFFTSNQRTAEYYAKVVASRAWPSGKRKSKPVILTLAIPRLDFEANASDDDLSDPLDQAFKYKGVIKPEWIVGKKIIKSESNDSVTVYALVWSTEEDVEDMDKAKPRTLYACRYVENAEEIIKWAKEQGFKTTLQPGDMHVTIAYSKKPVDWDEAKASDDDTGKLTVSSGGTRKVKPLGDGGAVVLTFYNETLQDRHMEIREAGASWDHARYNPHVTISWDAADVDLDKVKPYTGEIVLGPEVFKEIDEDWSDKVSEKHQTFSVKSNILSTNVPDEPVNYTVAKVDKRHGLVFGWAIVCKHKNCSEDYYDLNVDRHTGKRVPEHIPEDTMLEAATDFMEHSRVVKEMHKGDGQGTVVFAFPLTTDIAKAMGIQTQVTGLMVAMKPTPELLRKFESGELKGFSIGGSKVAVEDFPE